MENFAFFWCNIESSIPSAQTTYFLRLYFPVEQGYLLRASCRKHAFSIDYFPCLNRGKHFPSVANFEERAESLKFAFLHRAWTMSPEQSQYIWRKTIPHIEVGMGSGVFTSHRSARFVLISDWWTRRKMELLDFLTRPRLPVQNSLRPPATSGSKLAPYVGCPLILSLSCWSFFKPSKKRPLTIDRLRRHYRIVLEKQPFAQLKQPD